MSNTTHTIETAKIPAFEKMINRYNRKADKHNYNRIEFSYGKTYLETCEVFHAGSNRRDIYNVEVIDIEVVETMTNIEGYEFLGMAKTIDGINLIHNFTKQDDDGKHAIDLHGFKGTRECDHCGRIRNRNKVFLLTNDGGKSIKQIGSKCVNEYITSSSNDIASYFDFIASFTLEMSDLDSQWGGRTGERSYTVEKILTEALYIAKSFGYVTVSQAKKDDSNLSTKDHTVNLLVGGSNDLRKDLAESFANRFKDTEKAMSDIKVEVKQIMEWVGGIDPTNSNARDYLESTQEIYARGYCTTKLFGYVIGMISFWENEKKTKEAKKNVVESEYVGEIGTRQEFTGVIKSISAFEGVYGITYITRIDCGGNVVTYWNLIKEKGVGAEEGDTVNFWATPKKHEEYRGQKQTTISRATKGKVLNK